MTYKIIGCNKNIFLKRRKYVNTRICHRQRYKLNKITLKSSRPRVYLIVKTPSRNSGPIRITGDIRMINSINTEMNYSQIHGKKNNTPLSSLDRQHGRKKGNSFIYRDC